MQSFKAGAARRRAASTEAAAKAAGDASASSSTRGDFSAAICQICNVIDELVQRESDEQQQREREYGSTSERTDDSWRHEAIQVVSLMINSRSRTVQLRATMTISVLSAGTNAVKREVTEVPGMAPRLVELMKSGSLEAISAIAAITTDNMRACDLMRDADAIGFLAALISDKAQAIEARSNADSDKPGKRPGMGSSQPSQSSGACSFSLAGGGGAAGDEAAATDVEGRVRPTSLSDLKGSGLLPGMTAAIDTLEDKEEKEAARPLVVPVSSKTDALVALRNIALSSDANLEFISSQQSVIPQLVALMTKMHDSDDNRSANSGDSKNKPKSDHSGQSGQSGSNEASEESREREKSTRMMSKREVAERKAHGQEIRKLAESAGQMLHTLILQGKKEVKKIIINAIISTVQQPGSKPPEDVPALMKILRSTAEEQLSLVQHGTDHLALNSALEFGRWIKVPTIMLGEARNNFKATKEKNRKEEVQRLRRLEMGIEAIDPVTGVATTPRIIKPESGATPDASTGTGTGPGGRWKNDRMRAAGAAVLATTGSGGGSASGGGGGAAAGGRARPKPSMRKLDISSAASPEANKPGSTPPQPSGRMGAGKAKRGGDGASVPGAAPSLSHRGSRGAKPQSSSRASGKPGAAAASGGAGAGGGGMSSSRRGGGGGGGGAKDVGAPERKPARSSAAMSQQRISALMSVAEGAGADADVDVDELEDDDDALGGPLLTRAGRSALRRGDGGLGGGLHRAPSMPPKTTEGGLLTSDRLGPTALNAARRLREEHGARVNRARESLERQERAWQARNEHLAATRVAAAATRRQTDAAQQQQQRLGESDEMKRRFRELLVGKDRSLGPSFGVADNLLNFHMELHEASEMATSGYYDAGPSFGAGPMASMASDVSDSPGWAAHDGRARPSSLPSTPPRAATPPSSNGSPSREPPPSSERRGVSESPPPGGGSWAGESVTVIAAPVRTNYRAWNPKFLVVNQGGEAAASAASVSSMHSTAVANTGGPVSNNGFREGRQPGSSLVIHG